MKNILVAFRTVSIQDIIIIIIIIIVIIIIIIFFPSILINNGR